MTCRSAPSRRIAFIRHGTSTANEYMSQPGRQWGDPTFFDDVSMRDSQLSNRGCQEVKEKLLQNMTLISLIEEMKKCERNSLIVTSPLTRWLVCSKIQGNFDRMFGRHVNF